MLLARPIPKRESSGRFLSTSDVAKRLGVSAAAVRAMEARRELEATHITVGGIHLYAAEYIEERARARELRAIGRQQLDRALGFGQAMAVSVPDVQRELPLARGEER